MSRIIQVHQIHHGSRLARFFFMWQLDLLRAVIRAEIRIAKATIQALKEISQ